MLDLSPKQRFSQRDEEDVLRFNDIIHSELFHAALETAFADWVYRGQPTTEEMAGARSFVKIFINLTQEEPPLPDFPHRRLVMPKPKVPPPLPPRKEPTSPKPTA